MGIADLPCSGYVRDEGEPHYRCGLVFLLSTPSLKAGKIPQRNKAIKQGVKWDRAVIGEYQRNTNRHQKTQRPGPANTYYIESPAAQVGMVWVLRLDGRIAWSIRKGAGTITVCASAVTMLGTA
jgi:hypothetical protein